MFRGLDSPVAIASMRKPCGTVGLSPPLQPTTSATFICGSRVRDGSGISGVGPYWVDFSMFCPVPQAASDRQTTNAM